MTDKPTDVEMIAWLDAERFNAGADLQNWLKAIRDRIESMIPKTGDSMPSIELMSRFLKWVICQTPKRIEGIMSSSLTPTKDAEELAKDLTCDIYDPPMLSGGYDTPPEIDWARLNTVVKEKIQAALTAAEQRGYDRGQELILKQNKVLEDCYSQFNFYSNEHIKAGKTEKAKTNRRFADMCKQVLDTAPLPANSKKE